MGAIKNLRNAFERNFSFRQQPVEDAIKSWQQQREQYYRTLPPIMAEAAEIIDAQAGTVKIPRQIELVGFSKRFEFTRNQEFQVGP